VLTTFWAIGCAIRATLHFAALSFEFHTKPERSQLAKLTRRTTGVAIDAMYVIVPVLMLVSYWT